MVLCFLIGKPCGNIAVSELGIPRDLPTMQLAGGAIIPGKWEKEITAATKYI